MNDSNLKLIYDVLDDLIHYPELCMIHDNKDIVIIRLKDGISQNNNKFVDKHIAVDISNNTSVNDQLKNIKYFVDIIKSSELYITLSLNKKITSILDDEVIV